jgi:short-subunit dehydrogenase
MYRAGCNLIVTGSNQEKMDRLLADLVHGEGKVWSYICDLTKPKEIAHMIEKSVTECLPVDILINNVSRPIHTTFDHLTQADLLITWFSGWFRFESYQAVLGAVPRGR